MDIQDTIDPRIRELSYSSILTLHSCPRKFELYKKQADSAQEENLKKSVTFAFGHAFGVGVQSIIAGATFDETLFAMFYSWDCILWASDEKSKKSFAEAVFAIQKFSEVYEQSGIFQDYELAVINGKPAVELSFRIDIFGEFRFRGFVDLVLVHKYTREVLVLEVKTTGAKWLHEAQYKNSAQAIGYSIVLDAGFPGLSSYKVRYLVYKTFQREFEIFEFGKSHLQRAQWIRELLFDVEIIKMYEADGLYPMRGESCLAFNSVCEYFGLCTLSTERLTSPVPEDYQGDTTEYTVNVTIQDLIQAQLHKEDHDGMEVLATST
jgi:hypothetical protein